MKHVQLQYDVEIELNNMLLEHAIGTQKNMPNMHWVGRIWAEPPERKFSGWI